MTPTEFKQQFIARTKEARERSGYSQEEMAKLLKIGQGTYKNYEVKRLLPHHLVPTFCLICKIGGGELYGTKAERPQKRRKVA